jgi:hypothetical protein
MASVVAASGPGSARQPSGRSPGCSQIAPVKGPGDRFVIQILYVEDNDDNVYLLKQRFELLDGFEVLVAENGETACAIAVAEP